MRDAPADYTGPDRRRKAFLSEEQIEEIAERAADRAVQKMRSAALQEVGRWTLNKLMWILTVAGVGLYLWMLKNGWIEP